MGFPSEGSSDCLTGQLLQACEFKLLLVKQIIEKKVIAILPYQWFTHVYKIWQ